MHRSVRSLSARHSGQRTTARPLAPTSAAAIAAALPFALTAPASAAFAVNDLRFFAGTGENTSALVIDWNAAGDARGPSLAWGYRWSAPATAADMLLAVAAADPRLFVRAASFGSLGLAVVGLGYDIDGDGFALSDGTTFTNGLALTPGSDAAVATDNDDVYLEGFFSAGFWVQSIAAESPYDNPAAWAGGPGISARTLVNGGFDGFAFTAGFTNFGIRPRLPVAVPSPAAPVAIALAAALAPRRRRAARA